MIINSVQRIDLYNWVKFYLTLSTICLTNKCETSQSNMKHHWCILLKNSGPLNENRNQRSCNEECKQEKDNHKKTWPCACIVHDESTMSCIHISKGLRILTPYLINVLDRNSNRNINHDRKIWVGEPHKNKCGIYPITRRCASIPPWSTSFQRK